MNTEKLLSRVDEVLDLAKAAGDHMWESGMYEWYVHEEHYHKFRSAALSLLERTVGENHNFFKEFKAVTAQNTKQSSLNAGKGVLIALRQEIEGGWLFTVRGIVAAEIFTDFLEMAQHLLEQGYKDPAAVMIGGVLEEHLRQLCLKHGIEPNVQKDGKDVAKSADRMNAELASANAYSKLYQKSVTSWLDLRNKAAHGHYKDYDQKQVELMEQSVLDFIAKTTEQ